ncbi:DUF6300 family protein [Streptomyces sp. NPDC056601]|uniref:DUF6300 family protein n=1 Tax=Streptomyces sp. NPDC056601 TaxID=3345875 RepID=UPI0036A39D86
MAGRHVTNPDGEDILLNLDDVPPCTRCVSEALLRARFSHSWQNASGNNVSGIRTAELCPSCDQGRPAADELLTPHGRRAARYGEDHRIRRPRGRVGPGSTAPHRRHAAPRRRAPAPRRPVNHRWRAPIYGDTAPQTLPLVSPSPAEPASHTQSRPRGRVPGAGSEDRSVTGR